MFKVNGYKVIDLPDFALEDGGIEATVDGIFEKIKNATKPILTSAFKITLREDNIVAIPAMFTPFFYEATDNMLFAKVLFGPTDNNALEIVISSDDLVTVRIKTIAEFAE